MAADRPQGLKSSRSLDSAYSFSMSIGIGLILFIAGLVVSLSFSNTNAVGLIFGIPLIIAGLAVPIVMMRGELFTKHDVTATCPHCGTPIRTSDATIKLECPGCGEMLAMRDMKLSAAE
jgi:predicted RNA-binding Zn-ribbon protein involved in translation (DUF1610 family)